MSDTKFHMIRVPAEFHEHIQALEDGQRDLARLQLGRPSVHPRGPKDVEEAYRIVCKQRKWLYDWMEDNIEWGPSREMVQLRFT